MTITRTAILLVCLLTAAATTGYGQRQDLDSMIDKELPGLVDTYKSIHESPELSHHEQKTSALLAERLRALGYTVTDHVGKYDRPDWHGYGVVAIMKNGPGPTVLVRTDMDALPVLEKTGLPYASRVREENDAGQEVPVMHACGHDIHITNMIGTATMLARLKSEWHGTLMLIGQPAEETIDGAKAMLNDNLYERFGRPDYAIALHDNSDLEAGKIAYCPGYALASSTSVDVIIRGVGGHGSRPEATKDPIVAAAEFIMAIQTIVSRENSPLDPAVVTVGSIQGGTRYNIIPDEVHLQLTLRAYKEEVRQHLIASLERIAKGIAIADGVPENRAPIVKVSETEVTPATYNDPALTERITNVFKKSFGAENVIQEPPVMGAEDFGRFGLEGHKIPVFMFWLGAVDPAKVAESRRTGTQLPSLHSSLFEPLPAPTLRTGIKAMTLAVLDLMGSSRKQ